VEPEPHYVEQYVVSTPAQDPPQQNFRSRQLTGILAHSEAAPQKSPMIFVVPNSGQKAEVSNPLHEVELVLTLSFQAGRQPLLVNNGEQKNPIVISKFQSNGGLRPVADNRIKQGVIAQINGQKVEGMEMKIYSTINRRRFDHNCAPGAAGAKEEGAGQRAGRRHEVRPSSGDPGHRGPRDLCSSEFRWPVSHISPFLSSIRIMTFRAVQSVESQGGKQSILEQAMHEVRNQHFGT
jgi:hypothetical protein